MAYLVGAIGYDVAARRAPFARAGEHVLLAFADGLPAAGAALAAALGDDVIARTVAAVPDVWLEGPGGDRLRAAHVDWLRVRRAALPRIIDEANRVRTSGI